jgi:hypothetical protein
MDDESSAALYFEDTTLTNLSGPFAFMHTFSNHP